MFEFEVEFELSYYRNRSGWWVVVVVVMGEPWAPKPLPTALYSTRGGVRAAQDSCLRSKTAIIL